MANVADVIASRDSPRRIANVFCLADSFAGHNGIGETTIFISISEVLPSFQQHNRFRQGTLDRQIIDCDRFITLQDLCSFQRLPPWLRLTRRYSTLFWVVGATLTSRVLFLCVLFAVVRWCTILMSGIEEKDSMISIAMYI